MLYETNTQLNLAADFVQFTNQNIFLTGKAGTGKTTFLKMLKNESPKRMVIVAPTGVAAINAGGVTIHSFFQISFGPQIPQGHRNSQMAGFETNKATSAGIKKFNKEKINIIRSLDLLVIDEISMVRADLLDAIDEVLRRFKNRNKPFGGIQLLMIGDLQQLSPIVKDDEWSLLKNIYKTCYFFSSNALHKSGFVPIELKHIFRQSDQRFIDLLNNIRENKVDDQTMQALNERYVPNFKPADEEGYITLTTHNYQSQKLNNTKLTELKASINRFTAEVEGDFPEYVYPTDKTLELKVGAQVMFVKNDSSYEKRYYNGKIGKVIGIEDNTVEVLCPTDNEPIMVERGEWENAKYKLNEKTQEIEENVVGKFIQFPLKLAWAITIHKSQGLTFERAIIDARQSFAHGQVYVALSRCKTLEGMVLSTPIESYSVKNDSTVVGFTKHTEANQPNDQQLSAARKEYQLQLLIELFDFKYLFNQARYVMRLMDENRGLVVGNLYNILQLMLPPLQSEMIDVATRFSVQIKNLMQGHNNLEEMPAIQERIIKASHYFLDKLKLIVATPFSGSSFETDNKSIRKVLSDGYDKMAKEIEFKKVCVAEVSNGFKLKSFLEVKAKASIDTSKKEKSSFGGATIENLKFPVFYKELRAWRSNKSDELAVTVSRIIGQKTMIEIANELPITRNELKAIKGMGGTKLKQFGKDILGMVVAYRKMEGLPIPFGAEEEVAMAALTTQQLSLKQFKEGKTITEIAASRNLAKSTIESHLAQFVDTGELEISQLVDPDRMAAIQKMHAENPTLSTSGLRSKLGEEYSYGEVRLVLWQIKN
ncbi:MAG: helix-turn-helix domain-containing protein [Prolixibacteraceae bacterium]|jgi:nucleoside-triphosphatase THEP1|nr:helix-turn-helix domain-containing protein [Prolixibacteraceae bacterium]